MLEEEEEKFWLPIRKYLEKNLDIKRFSLVTTDKTFNPPDFNKIGLVISNIKHLIKVIFFSNPDNQVKIQKEKLFVIGPDDRLHHIRRILENSFQKGLVSQARIQPTVTQSQDINNLGLTYNAPTPLTVPQNQHLKPFTPRKPSKRLLEKKTTKHNKRKSLKGNFNKKLEQERAKKRY